MHPRLTELYRRRPELETCHEDLAKAFAALCTCFRGGGKLLICGNGGSAADAQHWASELLKGLGHPRALSEAEKKDLPADLQEKLQGALPAIALPQFSSLITAFANDVDPRLIFAQLVWALGKPGDVLVGISTSGNAENVCAAMETARAKKMICLGLTGEKGGRLAGLTDCCICVPSNESYVVQELHLPVYHCLTYMVEDEFFPRLP